MTDVPINQFINDAGERVDFVGAGEAEADDKAACQTIEIVSMLCWATHCAWEDIIGEKYVSRWMDLTEKQRQEIRDSVTWFSEHPAASIIAQHDAWRSRMITINPEHPNLKPFDELPFSQQVKARLWRHTILSIMG